VLIVSQFAPTSIFLHFQGLVAFLFAAKRKTKWCKTQNKMQYFAIYERFLGVVDGINIRLLGLKCGF
jgi:hypothetical protein